MHLGRKDYEIYTGRPFPPRFPHVDIGEHCVIEHDVVIGPHTEIKNYVEIRSGTKIGERCYIDSRVSFSGDDIVIEDLVTIRYSAIIAKKVWIKEGTFISPQVMFIFTDNQGRKADQRTVVGIDAFIGTASVINQGVQIGDGVKIAPMSFVRHDALEPGLYAGCPAIKIK